MRDLGPERRDALWSAAQLHDRKFHDTCCDGQAVLKTADLMFAWLTAPIYLQITFGPAVDQTTGEYTGNNTGGVNMAAYKDTDKFQLSVNAFDSKQQPTTAPTDITFTSSDTSIVNITQDPDGTWWGVAGTPGSVVVTVDWPSSPTGDIQGTGAVDISSGDAASIEVAFGSAVPQ